jgi:hypothetical protein
METLQKGQKINIQEKFNSKTFTLAITWNADQDKNLEIVPLFFNESGKLDVKNIKGIKILKDKNSIFKTEFLISIFEIPQSISKITFILLNSNNNKDLSSFYDLSAYIITDEVNFEYKADKFSQESICEFWQIYKRNNDWRFNVVANSFNFNLNKYLEKSEINKIEYEFYKKTLYENLEIVRNQNKIEKKAKEQQLITNNQIRSLKERIESFSSSPSHKSEESTKFSLIVPFLQILGFDTSNNNEVNPEYKATFGVKKAAEKVDFVILIENKPMILLECKVFGEKLEFHNEQLHRYFSATEAKIGILTNGIEYLFYSDLDKLNIMDMKPFWYLNLNQDISPDVLAKINKFHKKNFNLDSISDSAKYMKACAVIREKIIEELSEPSDDLMNLVLKKINTYNIQEAEQKNIFELELVNAIKHVNNLRNKIGIVTTQEELEGYLIIKTFLRDHLDYKRISYKDTMNYFGILLDETSYKTICRLWFNGKVKYLGLIDENKAENKIPINDVDDLFKYKNDIVKCALNYINN